MKTFWHRTSNVGDTLTPVLFNWLKIPFTEAAARDTGKLLGVGSILESAKQNDVVWGSGFIRDQLPVNIPGLRVLATRGPLSARILGSDCKVFGDPALLLPLMYNPKQHKNCKVGLIPHYVEAKHPRWAELARIRGNRVINVRQPWKNFVDAICECEVVTSSSLHGVIIAEAYGIPAQWLPVTDKVIGHGFKFHDYYMGTGRHSRNLGQPIPAAMLLQIQTKLIRSLTDYATSRN
jgi:pyruvyltransferase